MHAEASEPTKRLLEPAPSPVAVHRVERLLIVSVEDRPDDIELIRFALEDGGMDAEVLAADDAPSLTLLLRREPQIVLCDYNLPKFSPQAALALITDLGLTTPLVVVTRSIGESAAVDVLRRGARDYVTKDRLATLPQVIVRVLAEERTARQVRLSQQRLQAAHQRLRAMSARMIGVQERERQLVASELHEGLGQTLTSVLLHLDASERSPDGAAASSYRHTAAELVRETLEQLRTLSFTLRPAQLDLLGLAAAVRTAARMQLQPLGIVADLRVRGNLASASAISTAVVYGVVLGALNNAVRHAQPSCVRITLAMQPGGRLSATVIDDGIGFDVDTVLHPSDRDTRSGLTDLLERSELAGGRLQVRSRPGLGTLVRVIL